jgi:hypothetical protein
MNEWENAIIKKRVNLNLNKPNEPRIGISKEINTRNDLVRHILILIHNFCKIII